MNEVCETLESQLAKNKKALNAKKENIDKLYIIINNLSSENNQLKNKVVGGSCIRGGAVLQENSLDIEGVPHTPYGRCSEYREGSGQSDGLDNL